jgi:hypothetical protein
MTWRRALATAYLAMGTLLVLGPLSACNSPTLPTPPPVVEMLNYPAAPLAADGEHVDISGFAHFGATVIAVNRTLLENDAAEASAVTVAALDTGRYELRLRVDLRCVSTNVVDIMQRDDYGSSSIPRTFDAPNGFEDGAAPRGGQVCTDAGPGDVGADGEGESGEGGEVDASNE